MANFKLWQLIWVALALNLSASRRSRSKLPSHVKQTRGDGRFSRHNRPSLGKVGWKDMERAHRNWPGERHLELEEEEKKDRSPRKAIALVNTDLTKEYTNKDVVVPRTSFFLKSAIYQANRFRLGQEVEALGEVVKHVESCHSTIKQSIERLIDTKGNELHWSHISKEFDVECIAWVRKLMLVLLNLRNWMAIVMYEFVLSDSNVIKYYSSRRNNHMQEIKDIGFLKQAVSHAGFIRFLRENPDQSDIHDYMAYYKSDILKVIEAKELLRKPALDFFATFISGAFKLSAVFCRVKNYIRTFERLNAATEVKPAAHEQEEVFNEEIDDFVDGSVEENNFGNYDRHLFRKFNLSEIVDYPAAEEMPPAQEGRQGEAEEEQIEQSL
jgi:hypothetical protein